MSERNGNTINTQPKGTRGAGSVLDLGGLPGLGGDEAKARLAREGPNELPAQKKRNLLAIAFGVVREPMFLMLVAAGIIYLLMGEPADALMLIGFVLVVMAITIIQEQRTERALAARGESRTEAFGADSARVQGRAKRRILGVFKRVRTQQTGQNLPERRRGEFHHGC